MAINPNEYPLKREERVLFALRALYHGLSHGPDAPDAGGRGHGGGSAAL